MTTCNGCGCCCSPVVLGFTREEARTAERLDPRDRWFVAHVLEPIGRREGDALGGFWIGEAERERNTAWEGTDGPSPQRFYYRCPHFDEASRTCTDYNNRPPMCRDFPVRGKAHPGIDLPPPCSFRADQGLPVEPLVTFLARAPR